jgi:hypothetical protein
MNPYIQQAQGLDQQGLAPVFQNIAQQQATQNAAMNEQNQQVAQAGQTQNPTGFNNLAMAMMLRGKQAAQNSPNFGARADMALNSQASPYLQNQVSQLGSSTANPFSDYNMGTNGWGNYGE